MIYTLEEIKNKSIPIIKSFGIKRLCLFGSYAKGMATEDSDLDFIMDKGRLKGLQYISLVNALEKEFECHVNLISYGGSNKEFIENIKKEEVLIYERETWHKLVSREKK